MNSKTTFLFLFFVSIYFLIDQGSIQSSDGKIMYLLTQSMVENQSLSFTEFVTVTETEGPQYSKYGLGMSVLAVPFYVFGKVLSVLLGIEESMAKKKEKFLGADIKMVLDNGLGVNVPNFWWHYMRLFGYPFYLWLLSPILLAGVIIFSGYKLVQRARSKTT